MREKYLAEGFVLNRRIETPILLHDPSRTCVVEIVDIQIAKRSLIYYGVDVEYLMRVPTSWREAVSGKTMILFRLPPGLARLPTHRVNDHLAFRAEGAEDWLPSGCPIALGRASRWLGDFRHLTRPPGALLKMWIGFSARHPHDVHVTPDGLQTIRWPDGEHATSRFVPLGGKSWN